MAGYIIWYIILIYSFIYNRFTINLGMVRNSYWKKGEGAKLATVIFQMDNFGTRKLDGAKPDIIKQNRTNLATPLS